MTGPMHMLLWADAQGVQRELGDLEFCARLLMTWGRCGVQPAGLTLWRRLPGRGCRWELVK